MSKPMFIVHRLVELGERQYKAGSIITDKDVDSWEMSAQELMDPIRRYISKGYLEAAPDAVEPSQEDTAAASSAPPARRARAAEEAG